MKYMLAFLLGLCILFTLCTDTFASDSSNRTAFSEIFSLDTIGTQVAYFEKLYGPAKKVFGEERLYPIDGCNVYVHGVTSIQALSLEITDQCNFDLAPFVMSDKPVPANNLTFGRLDQETGQMGSFFADCLMMCGNAYDPSIYLIWEGPRANGFTNVQVTAPIVDNNIFVASRIWQDAMVVEQGEDWVVDTKFNCDHRYDPVARRALANISVTTVKVGFFTLGLCQE